MRRPLRTVLLAPLAVALLAGPATARAGDSFCAGENRQIAAASVATGERSLLCLLNKYRAENGRGVLPQDASLNAAARGHSEDMVQRGYFDHTSPEGQTPGERAVQAGYPPGAIIGENIGLASPASPRVLFEGWRKSPGHNENMLRPGWVNAGMGLAPGIPQNPQSGGTGTQLFGNAQTGASDTAVDLLRSGECATARARVRAAGERVKTSRQRLRRASSKRAKRQARRQLRRHRKQLARAQHAAHAACVPLTSYPGAH